MAEWLQHKLLQLGVPAWVFVGLGTLLVFLHVWEDTEFIAGKISSLGRIPALMAAIVVSPYTGYVLFLVGLALLYLKNYLASQTNPETPLAIELTNEPSFIEVGWGAEEDLLNQMTRDQFAETEAVPSHVLNSPLETPRLKRLKMSALGFWT